MPRHRGIKANIGGGWLDQDRSWRDVRPLHVNDPGSLYDDKIIRPMVGHDPRLTAGECPACAASGSSPRGPMESPEEREVRLSQGWDEAMRTARENERKAYG